MPIQHKHTIWTTGTTESNLRLTVAPNAAIDDVYVIIGAVDNHSTGHVNASDAFDSTAMTKRLGGYTGYTLFSVFTLTVTEANRGKSFGISAVDGTGAKAYVNSGYIGASVWSDVREEDIEVFANGLHDKAAPVSSPFPFAHMLAYGWHSNTAIPGWKDYTFATDGASIAGGNYLSLATLYKTFNGGDSSEDITDIMTGTIDGQFAISLLVPEKQAQAPTQPPGIIHTDGISFDGNSYDGETSITVTASEGATEVDGNPIYYEFEFFDGAWKPLALTNTSRTTVHVLPDENIELAAYRVRTYNDAQLKSDWVTSLAFRIWKTNVAPETPPSLTILTDNEHTPGVLTAGTFVSIVSGEAFDADGDTLNYEYTWHDGTETRPLHIGTSRSHSFQLPNQTLAGAYFRVRATDPDMMSSGWAESRRFDVNQRPSDITSLTHTAPVTAQAGAPVTVTASPSVDPEAGTPAGGAMRYRFDFVQQATAGGALTRVTIADGSASEVQHTLPSATVYTAYYTVEAWDAKNIPTAKGETVSAAFAINQAPPKPTSLTHTAGTDIGGGREVLISTTPSDDAEGENVTYAFEFWDGSVWTALATSAQLSRSHVLPLEVITGAKYRVRALDTNGFDAGWTESAAFNVNMTPSAPGDVTHDAPTIAQAGMNVTVSASGAVDPGGDPLTYEFEFWDGTSWTALYIGTLSSGAHTLPDVSLPGAKYRARSMNGFDTSAWQESTTFRINRKPGVIASLTHTAPSKAIAGRLLTVTAAASVDPEGATVRYSFDFWNGTDWETLAIDTTNRVRSHTPPEAYITGAKYRVRANDLEGGITDWVESSTFDIAESFQPLTGLTLPHPTRPQSIDNLHYVRDQTNALRAQNGMPSFSWADSTIVSTVTKIQAAHLNELQAALLAVYTDKDVPVQNAAANLKVRETVKVKHMDYTINKDLLNRYQALVTALQNLS